MQCCHNISYLSFFFFFAMREVPHCLNHRKYTELCQRVVDSLLRYLFMRTSAVVVYSGFSITLLCPRARDQTPAMDAVFRWGRNGKTPVYRALGTR